MLEREGDDPLNVWTDVELGDLTAWIGSLEFIRHLRAGQPMIDPYTILGVTAARWELDEDAVGVSAPSDDGLWRFGGVGGLGLEIRASRSIMLNLEFANFALGNPFDGDDGFAGAVGAETIDEPERVDVREFSLGLTFRF